MIAVNPDRTRCPYEVGDILQTINSTPPAQRWPGTQWQQITDRFVRGADALHPAGSIGGSWTHAQTTEEVGPHTHTANFYYLSNVASGDARWGPAKEGDGNIRTDAVTIENSDGGQPMDITNPYYSAYIWLRTG